MRLHYLWGHPILAAFPTLTNIAQLFTVIVLRKFPFRKIFTLIALLLSRIPLLIIGTYMWWGDDCTVKLLSLAMFVHFLFGSMGGAGWNSWVKDLVPESRIIL